MRASRVGGVVANLDDLADLPSEPDPCGRRGEPVKRLTLVEELDDGIVGARSIGFVVNGTMVDDPTCRQDALPDRRLRMPPEKCDDDQPGAQHNHDQIRRVRPEPAGHQAPSVSRHGDHSGMAGGRQPPLSGTYRGRDELFEYFAKVREETEGALHLEAESILVGDEHMGMVTRVTGRRNDRTPGVLVAQAITIDGDGPWSEYWALTNDQDAVDAFWS